MPRLRLAWRVFLVVEAIGVLASATAGLFENSLGSFLWGTGFILSLPGAVLVGPLVEHALWNGALGLRSIYALSLLAAVAANAVLWACGLWAMGKVRARGAI
jgi:hypothetical protein